jgi:hypothetical protein
MERWALLATVALVLLRPPSVSGHPAAAGVRHLASFGNGAWCWFADPRAIYFHGRTYAGWVDDAGYAVIAAIGSGHVTRTRIARLAGLPQLGTRTYRDDHDNPALLVEPDGRITAFYSHHSGAQMYSRTTLNPGDITSWGPQQTTPANPPGVSAYTYPNAVYLSAENETYLFWRGGGEPTFAHRDASGRWSQAQTLIDEPHAVPYVKLASNGRDTIYLAFTDGHPREHVTSIYFAEYHDGLLRHANGPPIAPLGSPPIRPAQADRVYDARANHGVRAWVDDIAPMPDGSPVILYTTFPAEGRRREYHYARWDGHAWRTHDLGDGGATITTGAADHFYSGEMDLDHQDPLVLYASVGSFGHHRIERLSTPDGGKSWRRTWITSGDADNVRPVVPRGLPSGSGEVLWMRGRYGGFQRFETSIVGLM